MARFIISHRLAGKRTDESRAESRDSAERFKNKMVTFASVEAEVAPPNPSQRQTVVVETDPKDLASVVAEAAKDTEDTSDLLVEPEALRAPAALFMRSVPAAPPPPSQAGSGATLRLTVCSGGRPVRSAKVTTMFQGFYGGQTMSITETDARGRIAIEYNPYMWLASAAVVVPREDAWSYLQQSPSDGMTVNLPELPRTGPLGWWHHVMGIGEYDERLGEGVRVGVVDTGVGPHPYLAHVNRLGAFLGGNFDASPDMGLDVADHGTHVSGIIGARPPVDSGNFGGVAPGAEVFVARVFPGGGESGGQANQGDIANAIDALADLPVHLINLSLGGPTPSAIERDAVTAALEGGVLSICASGNASGPVMYPAAYPEAVAVSAVGLFGNYPQGTLASQTVPQTPDRFSPTGLYLANFSNTGVQVRCTGPGVGIISTVPAEAGETTPYVDMSGTSMASPAVCARLATLLAEDKDYLALDRTTARAQRAFVVLAQHLIDLGLAPQYEGGGLPFAYPSQKKSEEGA